jgi:hypothetical protein
MASVDDMARMVIHLKNKDISCVATGHSLGAETVVLMGLRLDNYMKRMGKGEGPGCGAQLVERTELWAPPLGFYSEGCGKNIIIRRHGDDWINRLRGLSLHAKWALPSTHEEGLGLARINGHDLELGDSRALFKMLPRAWETVGPYRSHTMGDYVAHLHLFLINESYSMSESRAKRFGERWSAEDGARDLARDIVAFSEAGLYSPQIHCAAITVMLKSYYNPEFRSQAIAFAQTLDSLAPNGAIGKMALPADIQRSIKFVSKVRAR